jgi:hypothetical protein
MSVTFFAIDPQGAIMANMPEVNVSNANAGAIELDLGYRRAGDQDIPGGEMPVDAFLCMLLAAVLAGGIRGGYGNHLGALAIAARNAGADVISWA